MTVVKEVKDALSGLWSLLVGLKITGKEFSRKQITVHYPRKVAENLTTYRGHIELVGKPKEPAVPKCISCMMCASVCPSGCITVKKMPKPKPPKDEAAEAPAKKAPARTPEEQAKSNTAKGEALLEKKGGGKKAEPPKKAKPIKTPKTFKLDYNTCSLCGLCVQACPVKSLRFSTDIYPAGFGREEFVYDLMQRLRDQAAAEGGAEAADKPAAKGKAPKAGQTEEAKS